MALDIIGAGFGRTGTLSLKSALEQLGFGNCYHMLEVVKHPGHIEPWRRARAGSLPDWETLFADYRAAVDWPACAFWHELHIHDPDAKVILSVRDPDAWYDSVMKTIYPTSTRGLESDDPLQRAFGEWSMATVWGPTFGDRMDDRAHVIGVYERHNADVIATIPSEQLLVFEARSGWEPLCEFLEVDVPDSPYPRTNTTQEFLQNQTA